MQQLETKTKFKETEIGLIPEEWDTRILDAITTYVNRGIAPKYTEDKGVLVINQRCIRDGSVDLTVARQTDPEKKKIVQEKLLQSFDILINSTGTGTLGRVAQLKEIEIPLTLDSHVTVVRSNSEMVFPEYLGHYLKSIQTYIEDLAEGSTGQTELSRDKVKQILVPLPNILEQKSIAEILSSLDEKIELNHRMNKTLEEMGKSIFKRWFIDFEFPNEVGKPYKSSGGTMIDSELGEIPEGWSVVFLRDVCELRYGKSLISNKRVVGKYRVYGSSGITGYHSSMFVEGPAIIVARKGSIGNVFFEPRDSWAIDTTYFINKNPQLFFLYHLIQMQDFGSCDNSSAVPGLSREEAYNTEFVFPQKTILMRFEALIDSLYQSIDHLQSNISKLEMVRNSVLPKLISGRIRVET